MVKEYIKKILRYILIFGASFALLLGGLIASASIPKAKIKENVYQSAQFFCDAKIFDAKIQGVSSSILDRYADTILVAIAYQYDSENPLESIIWSSYFNVPTENENINLYKAVTEDKEANLQYLRWKSCLQRRFARE